MNIENIRARHALAAVESLKGMDVKKYVSYAKALPASILQNSLGQAMATLLAASKGNPGMENGSVKDAHRLLYDQVQAWLCVAEESPAPYKGALTRIIHES